MTRFVLIYIVCLMTGMSVHGQGFSIELSVEWRETETWLDIAPIASNSATHIPFLKMVYRNLTDQSIYARKAFYQVNNYPPVIWASLTNTEMDLADRVKIKSDYQGRFYTVEIGETWEVSEQGIDTSNKEHELDVINDGLFEVYTALETQQTLNELGLQKQLSCFKYPDKAVVSYREARSLIFDEKEKRGLAKSQEYHFPDRSLKEEEILKEYSDQFVLLNPGEAYEQEVNLTGFYLLGGSYEFMIANHSLPGYVPGKDRQKMQLPKVVNGYQLYEGAFLTNTVTIKFD